ncbi:hypothetical protein GCM10011344_11600 [Dokdonia pacifica]|uniref:DUF6734 domain-containing protein n=1 Tax=Dokdonia pacifica TaxID=1627892 RepID=A0A238YGN3_9FLAO|nr:DUF6734 family protein [Dokdonia pacifica]GGG12588.1 hypothetical protein GCM10011344_11600 [Dokdonia pacifica]SNR69958.1 hypothetical protein SAMN06265376_10233 [Dokdonia pacifica]
MKIIQSFWTGNIKEITQNNYGWVSSKYNLIGWILSANQLRKYYDRVELYTDALGAEILIDTLQLPYSKVHIVLNELDSYDRDLWAVAKIKTYSLQKEPFLHVDGDVFIWDTFPDDLMKAHLITQNLERTTDYYQSMWSSIEPHLSYIPEEFHDFTNTKNGFACNMGIVGGVDLAFYKYYAEQAFKFVDVNRTAWTKISNNNFNVFFEQLLYYELAKKHTKKVSYLFEDIPDDNKYVGFGDFDKVPNEKTYLHLLGNYKRDIPTYKAMEDYVMRYYPEYYKRLLTIFDDPYFVGDFSYDFSMQNNKQLIAEFASTHHTKETIHTHYFLSRDIHSIGLSARIRTLMDTGKNFQLYKLPCNKLFISGEFKEIIVKDRLGDDFALPLDQIDELLLSEITQPMDYSQLLETFKTYLDDDVTDADIADFIHMVNERILLFAARKVLTVLA